MVVVATAEGSPGAGRSATLVAADPAVELGRAVVAELSETESEIVGFLRARIGGAIVQAIADALCLRAGEAGENLLRLEQRDLVRCVDTRLPWGFGTVVEPVWSLHLTERCVAALRFLPWRSEPPPPPPQRVPPQFWGLFQSGLHPARFVLPADAVEVALRLLDSRESVARSWALSCLPVGALEQVRQIRSETPATCDPAAEATMRSLEATIAIRRSACQVQDLQPRRAVDGMRVASLPDLLAMKMDVILRRNNFRDLLDLATIDQSGTYRLEDGLNFHMKRYGTTPIGPDLERIVTRLEHPGEIDPDTMFDDLKQVTLEYLAQRATDLRAHLARLRIDSAAEPVERSIGRVDLGLTEEYRRDTATPPRTPYFGP